MASLPPSLRGPISDATSLGLFLAILYLVAGVLGLGYRSGAGPLELLLAGWPFLLLLAIVLACRRGLLGLKAMVAWPVVMIPFVYDGAVKVVSLDPDRFVDHHFARWDAWILGATGPPGWPLGGPVEELANLFYVSYYLVLPVGFLWAWRRLGAGAAARYGLALAVAQATCAVIWLLWPSGGYHPGGAPESDPFGPFTWFAHTVYAVNPHYAAAFPSSHAALAMAAGVMLVHLGASRWWIAWALGVAWSTAYGQYHYLVDAPPGVAIGAVAAGWGARTAGGAAWVRESLEARYAAWRAWQPELGWLWLSEAPPSEPPPRRDRRRGPRD